MSLNRQFLIGAVVGIVVYAVVWPMVSGMFMRGSQS